MAELFALLQNLLLNFEADLFYLDAVAYVIRKVERLGKSDQNFSLERR